MSKRPNAWKFVPVKRLGGFVKSSDNGVLRTCDVDSSVDVLAWNMDDSGTKIQSSNRFREFIYRRVNYENGKKAVFRWTETSDVFLTTLAFDEVYYLPFHKCFIGFDAAGLYLFDADPYKEDGWYLYAEPCEKCFVFGKFIMYSENGMDFGLYDSKVHRKIPPFFHFNGYHEPWKTKLFHSWTDDFFPVCINVYSSFMDCHGNCFCREFWNIERFENAYYVLTENPYGFDDEKGIPVKLNLSENTSGVQPQYCEERNILVEKRRDGEDQYFDALGNFTDAYKVFRLDKSLFSYYGEILQEKVPVNSYFKTPLSLPYQLGKRLYTCFFEISNNGKVGIINEETNEIVAEPIFDEAKYSGDGFRLTYGYKYVYLDELGNFLMEREGV